MIFKYIFSGNMLQCIQSGNVLGEIGFADSPFHPSNVSWKSMYGGVEPVNRSTIKYL